MSDLSSPVRTTDQTIPGAPVKKHKTGSISYEYDHFDALVQQPIQHHQNEDNFKTPQKAPSDGKRNPPNIHEQHKNARQGHRSGNN